MTAPTSTEQSEDPTTSTTVLKEEDAQATSIDGKEAVGTQKAPSDDKDKISFNDFYDLGKELGSGAFATVRLGTHKESKESFAIKVLEKSKMQPFDIRALKDEIDVLSFLRHDNIIRLYEVFEEKQYIYLVTEKVMGGMLFNRLAEKIVYTEEEARDVCKILLEVIDYCHQNQVAHRDIQSKNLLMVSEDDDSSLKLADFGFAKRCKGPKALRTQCGSPRHVAPEILKNVPYDTQVDMWSVGVVMYTILAGYLPFNEPNRKDLFRKIANGDYEMKEEHWCGISQEAKALVISLLTVDPDKRATAKEALQNPWISGEIGDLTSKSLSDSSKRLQALMMRQKLQGAIYVVMATHKLTSLGMNFQDDLVAFNGDKENITNGYKEDVIVPLKKKTARKSLDGISHKFDRRLSEEY